MEKYRHKVKYPAGINYYKTNRMGITRHSNKNKSSMISFLLITEDLFFIEL